ncbi:MAG: peptide ABC transporter substrate-binding protein [Anaerolineales bacterium]|nr:peptide ABC transporter substrate-binding protein [Anaerolineales bacterium]
MGNKTALWVVVLLAVVLVGCTETAVSVTPTPDAVGTPTMSMVAQERFNTLRIVFWQAPEMLNPHLSGSAKDLGASRIAYEPLATFDANGELVPFLAAQIPSLENGQVAEDGRSVTWKLREDVYWADGEPFTADDVYFTYQFIINPDVKSASASVYRSVQEVKVLDPYTVQVIFTETNPAWYVPFVGFRGMILPQHIFEAYNGANAAQAPANATPIGTGPYYAIKNEPQEVIFLGDNLVQTNQITFAPNPYFREAGTPFFGQVILTGGGSSDEAARLVMNTGEVDFAWNLTTSSEELLPLEELGNAKLVVNFGARVERLVLNHSDPYTEVNGERSNKDVPHPYLSDLRVRQALSYAIDRDSIAALYGLSGRAVSNNLVVPPTFASPNTSYEFNLDKAAALLDEAGWIDSDGDGVRDKEGIELRLIYRTPLDTIHQETQAIVRRNLAQIDVAVDLQPVDAGVFYSKAPDGVFLFQADMQELFIGMVSPDPGTYMVYWTCGQIPQAANSWSGFNLERWCNADYDMLYTQSTTELEPERRQQLFIDMNDLLVNDVVMIPLVHLGEVSAVGTDIEGLDPTPWDSILWNIKDWRRTNP